MQGICYYILTIFKDPDFMPPDIYSRHLLQSSAKYLLTALFSRMKSYVQNKGLLAETM